jgi:hypothetical protein
MIRLTTLKINKLTTLLSSLKNGHRVPSMELIKEFIRSYDTKNPLDIMTSNIIAEAISSIMGDVLDKEVGEKGFVMTGVDAAKIAAFHLNKIASGLLIMACKSESQSTGI